MTTIPTSALLALLCLAPFGILSVLGMLFVLSWFYHFEQEARRRKHYENVKRGK